MEGDLLPILVVEDQAQLRVVGLVVRQVAVVIHALVRSDFI